MFVDRESSFLNEWTVNREIGTQKEVAAWLSLPNRRAMIVRLDKEKFTCPWVWKTESIGGRSKAGSSICIIEPIGFFSDAETSL